MIDHEHRWIGSEEVCSDCGKGASVYIAELEANAIAQKRIAKLGCEACGNRKRSAKGRERAAGGGA